MTNPSKISAAKWASVGFVAAAAFALAQPAIAQEQESEVEEATELSEGEQRLARMLEGRVAGEPQSCIRSRLSDRFTTIDGTAYVYGRGRTIYVQRTRNPEQIDDWDALVQRRFNGSQICKNDITTTIDRTTGFFTGAVFFDDFIPYTRVDEDDG